MKKYIVMSIIAVVALLPFAAWADTGGFAKATLTFTAVINMIVDGTAWTPLEITQPDIAAAAAVGGGGFAGPMDWDDPTPDISVTVQSMTCFNVYSSYFAVGGGSLSTSLPTALGNKDAFLYLGSVALKWAQVTVGTVSTAGGFNYTAPAVSTLTHLTDWGTPGSANMFSASPGVTKSYNVQWDPTQLSLASLEAGDSMAVTVYFVVTDPST